MEEVTHEQCGRCKCWRLPSEFLNDEGRRLKSCEKCRALGRKEREKNKCPHGRECKSRCKDCLGHPVNQGKCSRCNDKFIPDPNVIINGKPIATCEKCRYKCEHGNYGVKYCEDCKTASRDRKKEKRKLKKCEHGKRKDSCPKCTPVTRCPHAKRKDSCTTCTGCPHGRRKAACKECNGGSFCIHNKQKVYCRTCDYPIHPQNWCHSCTFIKPKKRQFSYPYCFQCYCVKFPNADIPRKFKLKENHMCDALKEHFPELKMVFDKQVDGGCSRRRPDVRIECLTHTIVIECDENAHKGYSCETKRTMEIFQDLGSRPVVFLRFNPDKCEGQTCFTTTKTGALSLNKREWNKRIKVLVNTIKQYIPVQEKNVETVHLFYDKEEEDDWFMSLTEEQVKKILYG